MFPHAALSPLYVTQPEIHHRVVSFQEEFGMLLDAHGIAYDERYVWGRKGLFRPFRARVSVWVPLTQAFSLGLVRSPLWGSSTKNIPSSSSTLPPIDDLGECRGHCEGTAVQNNRFSIVDAL